MANVFGILAALVLAVAAFFGFTNKKTINDQQSAIEEQERKLDKNKELLEEAVEEQSKLEEATAAAKEESEGLTEKLEAQLAANKALDSQLSEKKSMAEEKLPMVEEGKEKLTNFGNLEDLKRNLGQLSVDLSTLNGELLQKNAELSSHSAASDSLSIENENLSALISSYTKKESNPGLKASVTRVVSGLGFVILSGGDSVGIVRDSILEVQRNGQTIGKLEVSGTESTTAAASIIPDSFAEGVRVRVGDSVVPSFK